MNIERPVRILKMPVDQDKFVGFNLFYSLCFEKFSIKLLNGLMVRALDERWVYIGWVIEIRNVH